MRPIFITGTGTDVGKTVVSAIVTEALQADYWKPIQSGFASGTDALSVQQLLPPSDRIVHPETYKLFLPASPHIAARQDGVAISLENIVTQYRSIQQQRPTGTPIVIEGAGGIMVPLNDTQFVGDLIEQLQAQVILVSRNYLGSINHSLLTASYSKQKQLNVMGWVFNDHFMNYEQEIVNWTGYPSLASIPYATEVTPQFIQQQAEAIRPALLQQLQ
ncbi:dethiobiotin synthetase [Filimonas lacunae]|uniref:ATP-dependent dethiobiotin synthetase BioD n=1 Tax=Filimonas lacunae TaxID=477680 RepID=A0A173MGA8_9BACT|nr:dethiobiotin synthase [Filimonas lacunae]BAV06536.1 dethiobiotin synthetase [Filimonas lacunae]SIT27304.1 dethiobiotin synthetase [Filimonas lacunae]